MKKFLLSLVGLFVAFAANAVDYYLIGGFNGWTKADPACKFTPGSNGEYTLDYVGTLTSGFKINDGTWENDDVNFGGNGNLTVGTVYTLVTKGNDITLASNIDNPHLVLNPNKKTLLITGQEVEAEYKYGIHGSIFDETVNWITKDMTEEDGKLVLKSYVTSTGSFGIKKMDKSTGGQTEWLSNVDNVATITLGTPVAVGKTDKNFNLKGGDYTLTFDPDAMTLLVEGTENGGDDPVGDDFLELYLRGEMTGTGFAVNPDFKMQTTDGVTYTLTVPEMTTGQFKFADSKWTKSFTYGEEGLENGEYKFTDIPNVNTSLAKGGTVTFTLVLSDDKESAQVTISGQEEDSNEFPAIYLVSSRNSFRPTPQFKMNTNDGQTYTLNVADAGSDIAFKLMVRTKVNDANVDTYFSNGEQNIHNGTFTLAGNTPRNMTLHTGGDVTFTVKPLDNYTSLEVTVEGQNHEADPYPPIYLVGTMTDWEAEEAYRLSTEDGHTYTITVPNMSADEEFQFLGTDAHNYWFSNGDKKLVAGTGYELTTGNAEGYDMSLLNGGNVTFTFVLSELHNSATLDIAITNEGGDDPIPPVGDDYPEHLYVVGNVNGNDWTPTTAVEMTTASAGVYTLSNASFTGTANFSFITKQAEWGGDLGDRYQDAAGDGGLMEPNAEGVITATLVKNPAEDAAFQVAPGIYDMKVDLSTLTLTMTKVGEVPIPPVGDDYPEHLYVIGMINDNGWNPSTAVEMTTGENGVYTLTNATIKGGDANFSFTTKLGANADDWAVGDRYQDANGDGGVMEPNAEGVITGTLVKNPAADAAFQVAPGIYDMTVDLSTLTLTMKKVGNVEIEEPTETEYYLVGTAFDNWANPSDKKFVKGENGEYTITLDQLSGDFKITDGIVVNGNWNPSYGSNGSDIELGVPYELSLSTSSHNLSFGNDVIKDVKMVFVPASKTLTVTGTVAEVEHEYVYSIHGKTSNEATAEWDDIDMTDNGDGTWTLAVDKGFVQFAIVRTDKALNNQPAWIKSAVAPAEGEVVIAAKGGYQAAIEGPSDFTSALDGKCTYVFNPETMMLTVDGSTGISAIEAEEGEAVYFNLQGQRIANPDKGIYIRVVNGKATKVVK
ncbi:MAG: SusF/SusE family outer membrane protein [Muribaculaceae bacterium]|nr:SusF/SusE family outer membrane protein [Muribaculaceae bacterium]